MLILQLLTLTTLGAVLLLPASAQGSRNEEIPDEFWDELSKIKTMKDFKEKFLRKREQIRGYEDDYIGLLKDIALNEPRRGEGSKDNELSYPCQLIEIDVPVPGHTISEIARYTKSVKLPRCGGYCESDRHADSRFKCLPKYSYKRPVTVLNFHGANIHEETIQMDAHSDCACSCSINASNCNSSTHHFESSLCKCQCKLPETKCELPKKWNERLCRCHCPALQNCLDKEVFNFESCRCEKSQPCKKSREFMDAADVCASHECSPGFKAAAMSERCVCLPIAIRDWISDYAFSKSKK